MRVGIKYSSMKTDDRYKYFIKSYKEQYPTIEKQLYHDEIIKHCIDKDSMYGERFYPQLAVTNYARVWNLTKKDWCKTMLEAPCHHNHRYHIVGAANHFPEINSRRSGTIDTSQLVANYFCDKSIIHEFADYFGIPYEHAQLGFEIHHIVDHNEIKSNEENNHAGNLQFVQSGRRMKNKIKRYGVKDYKSLIILDGIDNTHQWIHGMKKGNYNGEHYVHVSDPLDALGKLLVDNLNSHHINGLRHDGRIQSPQTGEIEGYKVTAKLKASGSLPPEIDQYITEHGNKIKKEKLEEMLNEKT